MKLKEWKPLVASLPQGLTVKAAADYLGHNYATVRLWLVRFKYRFTDGRKHAWPLKRRMGITKIDPKRVDWSKSNIAIAKQFNVSRERVRQIRNGKKG